MLDRTLNHPTQSAKSADPFVSIILNNYNYDRFLQQSIESCLAQTYPHLEVVVVDDGSCDRSPQILQDICQRHAQQDNAIALIPVFKKNGGQASALNAGIAVSRGDLLVLLDADDYLFEDAVTRIVAAWRPGVAMVQARLELVDAEGHWIDLYPAREISFDQGEVCALLLRKGRYSTTVTSGLSLTRSAFEQIAPIPEADFRISADGYLTTLLPFCGEVAAIETPIAARRKHGQNHWAAAQVENLAEQARRSIHHDFLRYHYLAQYLAQACPPSVAKQLDRHGGDRDLLHMTDRLVSLRLEPDQHPVGSDRPFWLAFQGAVASWTYGNVSHRRRLIFLLWFLWVGLMPLPWVKAAIYWRLSAQSRPKPLNSVFKRLRWVTQ